jgi:hypothetical protein
MAPVMAQRDQRIAQHDADAGRHSPEESTLHRALQAEQIDGAERQRQQQAGDETDRRDQK